MNDSIIAELREKIHTLAFNKISYKNAKVGIFLELCCNTIIHLFFFSTFYCLDPYKINNF